MSSTTGNSHSSAAGGAAVQLTLQTMAERPLAFAVELERRAALKRQRDRRYRARKRQRQEVTR
jgi:hypothetical protein